MIYEKTSLGLQELTGNKRSLNLRERQVLIMADGKRDENELIAYFQKEDTKNILLNLLTRGYIRAKQKSIFADTNPQASPASSAKQENSHILSEAELIKIKEIISKSTDCYLGIMGRVIKQKLEQANTLEKLKPIISEWHMALRDSKNGKEFAATLLQEAEDTIFKLAQDNLS